MAKRTAAQHEKHLNQLYANNFAEAEAIDAFIYLTNKSRGKATTVKNIRNHFVNHELGTLLRKYDSIAFQCSMND